jgi:formamidopyrimidine-DNA glycosylase
LPELPEVETIKNELSPYITGRRITDIEVHDSKAVKEPKIEEFRSNLVGQSVVSIERRGKYLVFRLSNNKTLVIHLRMTGSLLVNPEQTYRYARVIFCFDDGSRLVFVDRRRLGVVWLLENELSVLRKLGPEPLEVDFTVDALAERLRKRQASIKAVLLDQGFIAGIGNMYADEVLFKAKIHPLRKASSLSQTEIRSLYSAIIDILRSAISSKGASIDTYIRPDGQKGTAHDNFHVAHRRGEPCPVCGTPIERLPIRNRGSYFCPKCQKL